MALSIPVDFSEKGSPSIASLDDLQIIESWNPETNTLMYVTFIHITPDEEVYFGELHKHPRDITFTEYGSALKRIDDDEIYPKVPEGSTLKVAPEPPLDDASIYIKRPGLMRYEMKIGTDCIPKEVMKEAIIMEKISKLQHPHIVEYHGCRVRRGRVTGIVIERLPWTLRQYVRLPAFQQLDKTTFVEALQSAVDAIHSLGMAHNDINPDNIMVKDGMPMLIDFGSCQLLGEETLSCGTRGWREEKSYLSEVKRDRYPLTKLLQWL